jgi:hypothetical protein
MDIGSVFLILALMILVGLFIGRPFFERQGTANTSAISAGGQEDHEHSALLAERDRILNALQELDFDHVLGKIPDEDYPAQRAQLLQRGAEVLRKLDAWQAETVGQEAEERLEAAIAARRADARLAGDSPDRPAYQNGRKQTAAVMIPDDDLETMLAERRKVRQGKAGGFCPKCGAPLQKADRFCPKCGMKNT